MATKRREPVRLTDKYVQAVTADGDRSEVYDELTTGLVLRVSGRTGRKTWMVRYRINGRHRRFKLGTYPETSLAKARKRAKNAIEEAQAGRDPAEERRRQRDEDHTFRAMAEEVLKAMEETPSPKTGKLLRPDTLRGYRQHLNKDLLPAWGDRPAGSITRRDVRLLVERIARRAPTTANRTLATISRLFNGALGREFPGVEMNPAAAVGKPAEEGRRDRFLTAGLAGEPNEIRAVWRATAPEGLMFRVIFRVALLTGARMSDVCAMRWADIDAAGVWTISADTFKGRRDHLVPLSDEALAEIEGVRGLDDAVLFPGRSDGKSPHIVTTGPALRRIRDRTDIPHWVAHDFRATLRTHATRPVHPSHPNDPAGLGVAPHVADAVLGHKEASLGFDRYTGDRTRYLLSEKRDALARWGRFVQAAVERES